MSEIWYVQTNGKARACTAAEIDQLISSGTLDHETNVWTEGMSEWLPYGQSSLAAENKRPQPPPFPSPPILIPEVVKEVRSTSSLPAPPQVAPIANSIPPTLEVSDDGWQDAKPAPWRRYFARLIDVLALGSLGWFIAAISVAAISTELYERWFSAELVSNTAFAGVATCVLVLPLTTLLIGLTGSSPGKWIFGVRVTRRDGRAIGIGPAFGRELAVYFAGMGLGIPIIAFFTQIFAYRRLTKEGVSSWDENQPWIVTHRPQNAWQIVLYVLGGIGLLVFFVSLQAMK